MSTIKHLLAVVLVLSSYTAQAESTEDYMEKMRQGFNERRMKMRSDYEAYRERVNAEYGKRLSESWSLRSSSTAKVQPTMPEPPEPRVADPDVRPTVDELATDGVIYTASYVAVEPAKALIDLSKLTKPKQRYSFYFNYYGTRCGVDIDDSHKILLTNVDEKGVSKCWESLQSDNFDNLLTGCLEWKKELNLSDWGYVRFIEKLTNTFYGSKYVNEAKVMQFYLLIQSGYEARIARTSKSLYLLLPFLSELYEYPYITIDGESYYIICTKEERGESYYVFDKKFPQERPLSLQIESEPKLKVNVKRSRRLTSKRYPDVSVDIGVNSNLIDFYSEFPRNNGWDIYSKTSISSDVSAVLYPKLRQSIANREQLEQVEILLNFVQTAFDYMTDEEQFGDERPLFADETLFYPYCDCEDRSILFSILVSDLVGLDVVLVHYPEHLATAVNFPTPIKGDYLSLDGAKYTICDPTYIGAKVGVSMPDFKDKAANIIVR